MPWSVGYPKEPSADSSNHDIRHAEERENAKKYRFHDAPAIRRLLEGSGAETIWESLPHGKPCTSAGPFPAKRRR